MTDDPTADAIRYWWAKASQSLEAAQRDLAAGDQALAVSRAYYTLFYAVSALLLEEGKTFKKHSGVRATFNREFIKSGRIPREHGELYNRLFRDRQKGDYVAGSPVLSVDLRGRISSAGRLEQASSAAAYGRCRACGKRCGKA